MFLTRKALRKIRLIASIYFGLGVFLAVFAIVNKAIDMKYGILLILSAVCVVFGVLTLYFLRYSEGKAKLMRDGDKLIMKQLRPTEFLKKYQAAQNNPDNAVSKPDADVLMLVAVAYDCLDYYALELETMDKIISVLPEKKKAWALACKSAVLFSLGRIDEGEKLFNQAQSGKLDFRARMTVDTVYRSDRAKAYGDFNTVENYCKQRMMTGFPKNTPLAMLSLHYSMAGICEKTDRLAEAKMHYAYCAENGGETSIKTKSAEKLKELK